MAIIMLLEWYYVKLTAACRAAVKFLAATGIECTRQLLLHYRKRIEKNLNNLAMAVTEINALRAPPREERGAFPIVITEKTETKAKVRQLLQHIQSPLDDSLKIFGRTGATYLTLQAT